MERTIQMSGNRSLTVDDEKHKIMTQSEWMQEGKKRFGEDFMKWKFVCPMCGHVASVQDFKDAGAKDLNCAYQECIGRYTGKGSPKKGDSSGCNWAAYGLFGIPNGKGIIVINDDTGKGVECYDFAESEEVMENTDLIKLKFLRDGQPSGREYTYISKSDVAVGDTVQVKEAEPGKDAPKGIVTAVNVPYSEVESFKDKLKAIVGKVCFKCENCEHLIACGEGDHLCTELDEPKMVISDYMPTDEYMACGGRLYKEN